MLKTLVSPAAINANLGLLSLRLFLGFTMLMAHGLPKLNGFPSPQFPDPLGLGANISMSAAIASEVLASLLVILGLWTRLALGSLIFTMIVAVFIVHAGDPFAKKELGLIYLFGYVTLLLCGPGKHSIDQKLAKRG